MQVCNVGALYFNGDESAVAKLLRICIRRLYQAVCILAESNAI